jgi:dienelactone hydrolase
MSRHVTDGRRFLVQALLCVHLVIWGAGLATADEAVKAVVKTAAEYGEESFSYSPKKIRVWRFDPKEKDRRPAVLLLHGADGGVGVEKLYCGLAKRVAEKGYVVFIVHYLDATKPDEPAKISDLVKRAVRDKATEAEEARVANYFDIWTSCVSEAVGFVRTQQGVDGERVGIVGLSLGGFVGLSCAAQPELKIAAVASGFGGLPKNKIHDVKWLPPTLIVHGDEEEVVPVQHAFALRRLKRELKLPIEVKIYEEVGHVFQIGNGKFHWWSMADAERRMTEHLQKHLQSATQDKLTIGKKEKHELRAVIHPRTRNCR